MAANELKPCQCGSDVELCRGDDDYYIYCPKCKLKTFSDRVYDNITDNCDRLIEVWNKRVDGLDKEIIDFVMTIEEKIRQMSSTSKLADALENPTSVFCCDDCKYNPPRGTCKKECRKVIIEWLGEEAYLDRSELL